MTDMAKAIKMNRATLYRLFQKDGNPGIKTLRAILRQLSLRLYVVDWDFNWRQKSKRLKDEPKLTAITKNFGNKHTSSSRPEY